MTEFASSLEHLMAELERIDLRLRLQVLRMRQRYGQPGGDEFRGLYVSEQDMDALIASGPPVRPEAEFTDAGDSPLAVRLRDIESEICEKEAASLRNGVRLRLRELGERFGLSRFELDAILICMLPEIDVRYEKVFAYLHDDVTRKRPSVNLLLQCLLDGAEQRLEGREVFLPLAPLVFHGLLRVEDETMSGPLLTRSLKVEDRVVSYLLGSDQLDSRLRGYARLIHPEVKLEELILADELRGQLRQVARRPDGDGRTVVYIQGPSGVGKRAIAEALCRCWGVTLLMVDVAGMLGDESGAELGTELAFFEAKLQGAALCWVGLDHLLGDDRVARSRLRGLTDGIRSLSGPVLATGEAAWQPGVALGDRSFVRIGLPLPSYVERELLWRVYLDGHVKGPTGVDLSGVADKFRLTPVQIRDAAATARNMAMSRGGEKVTEVDLYAASRAVSSQKLNALARKIQPKFVWDDIVLPRDQVAQLREICSHVNYRHVVYGEWNFDHKVSLGRGLNILFAGPSGTGKTMAAEIIASELGLDLYKIDLSTVISKYIGETEKNLDRIFTEAQNSNSVLFFDEADAVFGKRSEVRDSHDRYANIEIAYLLQKMEEYDGIVILATNLRKNMDEAFARRMHFSIEFPVPEERDRYRIWRGIFPEEAPLSGDADLGFMARRFKITGGNIKNIALGAAFLAAEDGHRIETEHLVRATKREYQKIGRLCTEADFGPYFELVKG